MKAGGKQQQSFFSPLPALAALLWLLCLLSAVAVVYSTWQARKATQQLEELRREKNGLQIVSGQLMLEKSSWATYVRVEQLAQEKLNMRVAEPESTVLVLKKQNTAN